MPNGIITRAEARLKGLQFYYTGPCKYGHVAPRRTTDRGCTACRSRIDKKSYHKHHYKRIEKSKRWNAANPERCAAIRLANAENGRLATKKWAASHRAEVNAYRRNFTAANPGFRIRINLANRINQAIRYVWGSKSARTLDLIGCTIEELRVHIERQFLPGMSWDNYGYGDDKWHIDHIRPAASFDLTDPEQQRECFRFTNLQPLWQPDNFRKNKRFECPDSPIGLPTAPV